MEQESESVRSRALPAVVVALVVLGAAALLGTRGCLRSGADEGRFVRTSAPRQVSGPGEARLEPERVLARGEAAPELVLPDLAGTMTDLASWRGRPVVLNVWASWCAPCVREMPSIQALHEQAGDRFAVVTVTVDGDRQAARALVERFGLTAPVLLDAGGERLAEWGTVKYPETWILDREGRVADRVVGERDWSGADVIAYLSRL